MDKNKKYQILKYGLLACLLLFSFGLWRAVDRAIFVKEASVWMAPVAWSSLFFIFLTLAIILIRERSILLIIIAIAFFLSFIYSFSGFHFLISVLAVLLVLMADGKIREDFRERLKINLGKNIRAGSTLIVFALSLLIAAQYYFQTKDLAMEKYLPRFEIGKETNGLMLKIVSSFIPQIKDLGNDNLTVDRFLNNFYEKQRSGGGLFSLEDSSLASAQLKNLNPIQRTLAENAVKDAEKTVALAEGEKKLSQIALREVNGNERISDVFSEIVNKKINGYFMPSLGSKEDSPPFSAIIAIAIFLTATSLGSFMMLFWIPLVKLVFFIFKKSGSVLVTLIPAEKEVIE